MTWRGAGVAHKWATPRKGVSEAKRRTGVVWIMGFTPSARGGIVNCPLDCWKETRDHDKEFKEVKGVWDCGDGGGFFGG